MDRKKIIIGIMSVLTLAFILLGITYAYYRTRVIGNKLNESSISVVSKNLGVSYSDNNSIINATSVIPGFESTKTFSVENIGEEPVTYEVYLENVVNEYTRTKDWTYSIICTDSNGDNCTGVNETEYPTLSGKIFETTIASKVTQTYTLTIKYAESIENQSIDMSAKLEGKIQIYSPEYVVDIEGSVTGAEDGDYIQINSKKKTSRIVNGKYKLVGVEVGRHTLTVRKSDGSIKGSASITIETGTAGVSGSKLTIDDNTKMATINITNISSDLGFQIIVENSSDLMGGENPYTEGTLAYAILKDNEVSVPLTVPGKSESLKNEAVLAKTEDDYGTSYYFRGNVENNYINFAGLCWRIVRVQGDGSTKLILEDINTICNDNDNSDNIVYTGKALTEEIDFGQLIINSGKYCLGIRCESLIPWKMIIADFKEGLAIRAEEFEKEKLSKYTSLLKNGPWCTGYTKSYLDKAGTTERPSVAYIDLDDWKNDAYDSYLYTYHSYYDSYVRINYQKNPKLNCIGNKVENYKSGNKMYVGTLTADEVQYAGNSSNSYLVNSYILENDIYSTRWYTLTNALTYGEGYSNLAFMDEIYAYRTNLFIMDFIYDSDKLALRPSINLIQNIKIKNSNSDGTQQNPYEIDFEIKK